MSAQTFNLFVTSIESVGPLLKIWGQTDQTSIIIIEKLMAQAAPEFDAGHFVPDLPTLRVGQFCIGKYQDGSYYRARIENLSCLRNGNVLVNFIDYGNTEMIPLTSIRMLNKPSPLLSTIPLANPHVLAGVVHAIREWDQQSLDFITRLTCNRELKAAIITSHGPYKLIDISVDGEKLSDLLIKAQVALPCVINNQIALLNECIVQRNMMPPFPLQSPPTSITQNPQQMQVRPPMSSPIQDSAITFKNSVLPMKSEHLVVVSAVEDGPKSFAVQLLAWKSYLQKINAEINDLKMSPLTGVPSPGTPCIAINKTLNNYSRAVFLQVIDEKCKVHYVDYGNNDIVNYTELFQLPPKFIGQRTYALRFSLANLKTIRITAEIKQLFSKLVLGKNFRLVVSTPEGPPVVQYGELYDERDQNVLNMLKSMCGMERYRRMPKQSTDCIADVVVTYVKSLQEFYIHFLTDVDNLNRLMSDLAKYCESNSTIPEYCLQKGTTCCALFPDDEQWYRAEIIDKVANGFLVKYVDYGNEGVVTADQIKDISAEFVQRLPVQAVQCCMKSYETNLDSQLADEFYNLVVENKFTMHMFSYHNDNVLLVDLSDPITSTPIMTTLRPSVQQIPSPDNSYKTPDRRQNEKTPPRFRNKDKKVSPSGESATKPQGRTQNIAKNQNKKRWSENTEISPMMSANGEASLRPPLNPKKFDPNRKGQRNDRSTNNKSNWGESDKKDFNNSPRNDFSMKENGREGNQNWRDANKKSGNWRGKDSTDNSWDDWRGGSSGKTDERSPRKRDDSRLTKKSRSPSDGYASDQSKSSDKNKRKPRPPRPPPEYAQLSETFEPLQLYDGSVEDVRISWFHNPKRFYVQVISSENEFKKMMGDVQRAYKMREPAAETLPSGTPVIAHFKEDGFLYRAVILDMRLNKYKVRFVDYGNTNYVDKNKVWRIERRFLTNLPIQTVLCTLPDVEPVGASWIDSFEMDECFNKNKYQCVFTGQVDDQKHVVNLSYGGHLVVDELVRKGLAKHLSRGGPGGDAVQIVTDTHIVEAPIQKDEEISQIIPGIEHDLDDAPIDIELLGQQTIRVYISCANGLEEFFVQLNHQKSDQIIKKIDETMNSIDKDLLELVIPEKVTIGMNCVVKTDDLWLRCNVSKTNCTSGVYVDFVDVGGGDEIGVDQLYMLPVELTNYFHQAIKCSLHNYFIGCLQTITDELFQEQYEHKTLLAFIDEASQEKLLLTLYDLSGMKLDLVQPDEGAFPVVYPVCPMPVFHNNFKVWVSHINSIDSIYVQCSMHTSLIENLFEEFNKFYQQENQTSDAVEVVVDKLYACKSAEGNWYRGRAIEIIDNLVNVLYIDYGNQENIEITSVRKLDSKFYEPHELALHVALPIEMNDSSIDILPKLRELLNDKEFVTKVGYSEGCWYVELYAQNNVAVSDQLVEQGLGQRLDFDPFRRRGEVVSKAANLSASNIGQVNSIALTIVHVDSPNQFFAQFVDDETAINALQDELQVSIESLAPLTAPDAGVLCAAKYSANDNWYRAEVLDADDQITTVRFIDFGNTDVLSNDSDVIKTLPVHMLTINRYAKKCSLNLSPIVGDEWSQIASEAFEEKVIEKTASATIIYEDDRGTLNVDLVVDGVNIGDWLVGEGLAVRVIHDVEEEISSKTGFVSHANGVSEFWIQLESSCADLELVADHLLLADKFPDLSETRPGVLCAAKYPDDDQWYRARILTISDKDGINVLYIDYGNSSITTELKMLPEQVINIRALALKCTLYKPDEMNLVEWPASANEKFADLAADGATVFDVKVISTGETSTVELAIDGVNILDRLLQTDTRLPPIGEVPQVNVLVTHVESPQAFWVQYEKDLDNLGVLNDKLTQLPKTLVPLENVNKNQVYLVAFNEDLWRRTQIQSVDIETKQVKILFIDFGGEEITENVYELPEDLTTKKGFAKKCNLVKNGEIIEAWSVAACNKFQETVGKTVQIDNLESNEETLNIDLYVNEESMFDTLKCVNDEEKVVVEIEVEKKTDVVENETISERRSSTPSYAEKIVPGSISRGDLEEPTEQENDSLIDYTDNIEETIKESDLVCVDNNLVKVESKSSENLKETIIKEGESKDKIPSSETESVETEQEILKEETQEEETIKEETQKEKETVKEETQEDEKTIKEETQKDQESVKEETQKDQETVKEETQEDQETVKEENGNNKEKENLTEKNEKTDAVSLDEKTSISEEILIPKIPAIEKIVPGAICRGDLETTE